MKRKGSRSRNREVSRQLQLEVVHCRAAGIDIGGSEHYVAIDPQLDEEPVRRFGCFTKDLYALADWLCGKGIKTVAMQATGVYWITLYEVLEARGIEVFLVNARHTKNLPGRKSDVQECQWLLQLHTYGLLRNSFQPTDEIRILRTLWRHRASLVTEAASCLQRMQKCLTQMNIQIANVISDLSGVTGMAIVRALLAGERDPWKLARLAQPGVKASAEAIAESLRGHWREEILFVMRQQLELYDNFRLKIAACDEQLQSHLRSIAPRSGLGNTDPGPRPRGKRPKGNTPKFDLRQHLFAISGVDWARVDGIDVLTAQTVIAETGVDMSRWPTEKHFASWLDLCPVKDVSGGKVIRRPKKRAQNRATVAFRQAATTLLRSKSYLGAQYRRFRHSLEKPRAVKAMAHKLARLFYRLLRYGQQYVDKGMEFYENRFRDRQILACQKRALHLGFQLVPSTTPTSP
jgi:transposase